MKVKQLLISIASVVTFALVAVVVATNQNTQSLPSFADPAYKEETLNAAKLATCTFSAYKFDNKNDSRKFTYSMPGGKFIEGAILFGDCGYQYVGANLSEPFGINNTSGGNKDLDFHIFFNAHGLTRAELYFDVKLDKDYGIGITLNYGIKLSDKCADGLYEELKNKNYSIITERKNGTTDFYKDETIGSFGLKSANAVSEDIKRPNQYAGTINAAALQFNAFTIPPTYGVIITLTKVVLRYTC